MNKEIKDYIDQKINERIRDFNSSIKEYNKCNRIFVEGLLRQIADLQDTVQKADAGFKKMTVDDYYLTRIKYLFYLGCFFACINGIPLLIKLFLNY